MCWVEVYMPEIIQLGHFQLFCRSEMSEYKFKYQ